MFLQTASMAGLKFYEGQNHMQKNTPNSWPDLEATQQKDWEALAQVDSSRQSRRPWMANSGWHSSEGFIYQR